jgi:hypothetical protein
VATQKTYRSQIRRYLPFCLDYDLCPLPALNETVICYDVYLSRHISANSILNYLNVIRLLHLEAGLPNLLEQNNQLNMVKRGICREKGVAPVQKAPITLGILRSIYGVLDLTKPSDLAFMAASLVASMALCASRLFCRKMLSLSRIQF